MRLNNRLKYYVVFYFGLKPVDFAGKFVIKITSFFPKGKGIGLVTWTKT